MNKDAWSYLTCADGLPSDQSNSLAFDKDGNAYLGSQSDGIAMASAKDNYRVWKSVAGPKEPPLLAFGDRLPTNYINEMYVAQDGTVYAATSAGLAWSIDKGANWQFVRGAEFAAKDRGRSGIPPIAWKPEPGVTTLLEDYVTSLSEDSGGNVYVGHRGTQPEVLHTQGMKFAASGNKQYLTCFASLPGQGKLVAGSYGDGLLTVASTVSPPASTPNPRPTPTFPTGAAVLTIDELNKLAANPGTSDPPLISYLGEDWATQGDWVGRYGRDLAVLCGAGGASDHYGNPPTAFKLTASIGPQTKPGDSLRGWIAANTTTDPRALFDPLIHARCLSEYDDHGEAYPRIQDGPNIELTLTVPTGTSVVSLYFLNNDGHGGEDRFRDFIVEMQPKDDAEHVAFARVAEFWGGVYKRFYVAKPGTYLIRVLRNYSVNTILSGVFVDRIDDEGLKRRPQPLPGMYNIIYQPSAPPAPVTDANTLSLMKLWQAGVSQLQSGTPAGRNLLLQVLRAAIQQQTALELQEQWRWQLALSDARRPDYPCFNVGKRQGRRHTAAANPGRTCQGCYHHAATRSGGSSATDISSSHPKKGQPMRIVRWLWIFPLLVGITLTVWTGGAAQSATLSGIDPLGRGLRAGRVSMNAVSDGLTLGVDVGPTPNVLRGYETDTALQAYITDGQNRIEIPEGTTWQWEIEAMYYDEGIPGNMGLWYDNESDYYDVDQGECWFSDSTSQQTTFACNMTWFGNYIMVVRGVREFPR